jgi:hypothetical protein
MIGPDAPAADVNVIDINIESRKETTSLGGSLAAPATYRGAPGAIQAGSGSLLKIQVRLQKAT